MSAQVNRGSLAQGHRPDGRRRQIKILAIADYRNVATPKPAAINTAVIAAQVDELGGIERELAPIRHKIAREEYLKKAIRATFEFSEADKPFEANGAKYTALLGPKALQRSLNPLKLIKAIGVKAYAAIAKVTLTDLENNVAAEIVAGVVTSANTGTRSLKIFAKAPIDESAA